MSSIIRDIGEAHEGIVYCINNFLYEDAKKKIPKKHTEEEYREFLESLKMDSLSSYNDIAHDHGWLDDGVDLPEWASDECWDEDDED